MAKVKIKDLLSKLDEQNTEANVSALNRINELADDFWPELSNSKDKIINFLEKTSSAQVKELAYSILSKINYHTDDTEQSFKYAMLSKGCFNKNTSQKYVQSLEDYAISIFVSLSRNGEINKIPQSVLSLVNRIINLQIKEKEYCSAFSIATKAQSPELFEDVLEGALCSVSSVAGLCDEKLVQSKEIDLVKKALSFPDLCPTESLQKQFACSIFLQSARRSILEPLDYAKIFLRFRLSGALANLLLALTLNLEISSFLFHMEKISDETNKVERKQRKIIIENLNSEQIVPKSLTESQSDEKVYENELIVLQIAFDLVATSDKQFVKEVTKNFCLPFFSADGGSIELEGAKIPFADVLEKLEKNDSEKLLDPEKRTFIETIKKTQEKLKENEIIDENCLRKLCEHFYTEDFLKSSSLRKILTGEKHSLLNLAFMHKYGKESCGIFLEIIKKVDFQNQLTANALTVANAFKNYGTSRAFAISVKKGRWNVFSYVASIGAVYMRDENAKEELESLLRNPGSKSAEVFRTGGYLYGLGLAYCHTPELMVPHLIKELAKNSGHEVIEHGACLGLGICSVTSRNDEVTGHFIKILEDDNPLSGQAAAIGIGMNNMGDHNKALSEELLRYAKSTKHEKIIFGLALSMSLLCFRGKRNCGHLYNTLLAEEEEILRYGGCFALGLAFAGSEDSFALKTLLEKAVSDVSNDVKRAAILAIFFVMCRVPEKVLSILRLFVQSFNPHVRYGAVLAIGLAFSGSGNNDAIQLLKPLVKDKTDFVRHIAMQAVSLILMQSRNSDKDTVQDYVDALLKTAKTRASSDLYCFVKGGAIIGLGILEAGKKNVAVDLTTPEGVLRPLAVVGVLMFMQSWHWFPYNHFLCLSFSLNAFIGITSDFKVPRMYRLFCHQAKEFDFPDIVTKKTTTEERKEVVKLSISKNTKASKNKKKSKVPTEQAKQPQLSGIQKDNNLSPKAESNQNQNKEAIWLRTTEEKVGRENLLESPCVMTDFKMRSVGAIADQRYRAIKKCKGVVMLRNRDQFAKEVLVDIMDGIGKGNTVGNKKVPRQYTF